jgi:hypothetical protein
MGRLPASEKWALDFMGAPDQTAAIAHAISPQQCFAISDPSYKEGCGTAAFILVGPSNNHSIRAVHRVPGPIPNGNLYRCELPGIVGVPLLVCLVCTIHGINDGSVHVRCDNKSVLKIFGPDFFPNPSCDSFDLVHAVWKMLQINVTINIKEQG